MRRRRPKKGRRRLRELPRPPLAAVATYAATLADLFDRLAAAWGKILLDGWDEHIRRTTGGRIREDALPVDLRDKIKAVRVATARIANADEIGTAADEVAARVNKINAGELVRVYGFPSSALVTPREVAAFRERNVDLVRSITDDSIGEFSEVLEEADVKAWRVETLRDKIEERFDVSKSRAELLARDQVLKLNGQLTKARHEAAGVKSYEWSTSNDERVRPDHLALDGTINEWTEPPIVDERTGRREHPGGDFQCRCVAVPIIPWLEDDEDGS
jgi:SPP1 gp7 family putative phage head morphogenesis protein